MQTAKIDLRTPLQIERDERNEKIWKEYLELKATLPKNTTQWSIFRAIGKNYGLEPQGVRGVIKKMTTEKSK